ncbi:hypothetical protein EOPP23_16640 [Endozoicomonas sp. OPT23]|uniref:hypothetical protein n=1 Tax=Endozoicomonas sp. OPT23 TaxID=2072845 RepID=UPI00129A82F1|nr:hypothetical protein [Endozoicomonas sp. OPT23]MRI34614.1 hypothetical protein [Endozoicomonas sp. OPT23]
MKTQQHFATSRPRKRNSVRQNSQAMAFETWPQTAKPLMKNSSRLPTQKGVDEQCYETGYN